MSLLVVGSIALDTIKTPFGSLKEGLGGSATYFSMAAQHLTDVNLVAVVGEDFSPEYVKIFQDKGIDKSERGGPRPRPLNHGPAGGQVSSISWAWIAPVTSWTSMMKR